MVAIEPAGMSSFSVACHNFVHLGGSLVSLTGLGIVYKRWRCYNEHVDREAVNKNALVRIYPLYRLGGHMKYTLNQISHGEDEVIIKYREMNSGVERLVCFLEREQRKLIGKSDTGVSVIDIAHILYIESVEGKTFAYMDEEVIRLEDTLTNIEKQLQEINFFRCSKSMIINIDRIAGLKSLPSNRIDAVMENGEHVMISRTYASDFRKRLKRGMENG